MDVRCRTQLLRFFRLAVVYYQRNSPNINTPADSLRAQQNLYLLIPQLGNPVSLGGRTVLGMDMVGAFAAEVAAIPMDVFDLEVDLGAFGVVDDEGGFLFF